MSKQLLTWVDVEQRLRDLYEAGQWPQGLVSSEAYWTGLRLFLRSSSDEQGVRSWLRGIFGSKVAGERGDFHLELDSNTALPIDLELDDGVGPPPRYVPSFVRPSRIPGPKPPPDEYGDDDFHDPPLVVFHSYKGGVGRTTHALAFALETVEYTGGKVLLVDGDFEAPGLSWHIRTRYPEPEISYADLLVLAHADEDPDAHGTIQTVATHLRNQEDRGIYVLPSFREVFRWEALDIRPDHLMSGRSPYALSTLLCSLGQTLGVKAVIVDLRAGLSELSAGLLLDPRVFRVLVASVGEQSLRGVEGVAKQLRVNLGDRSVATTHFVISHVPAVLREADVTAAARESLLSSLSIPDDEPDEGEVPEVVISEYDLDLVTLPLEWERALAALENAKLPSRLRPLIERSPILGATTPRATREMTLEEARRHLADRAADQIFAESGQATGFLRIEPLTRLAGSHRTRLPVVVVTGSRGAGKTYTFFQLLGARTWSSFVEQAIIGSDPAPGDDVVMVPLLGPRNVTADARRMLDQIEHELDERVGSTTSSLAVADRLLEKIESGDASLTAWRSFWFDAMAWRVGCEPLTEGAGERLLEHLRAKGLRVVFVVDGLEDKFQKFLDDEVQRVALRALLQDVPERLEGRPGDDAGLIVLVRPDLVRTSIAQNSQQFLARYRPYAIQWSQDAALKLAIWLAVEAGALQLGESSSAVAELSQERRDELLVQLWGTKLGSTRSKEARSKAWVTGVLSDFEGQIQARDIVRLLHHAARRSVYRDERFDDRLLDPRAMRQALKDWGAEKIGELEDEDTRLKAIFDRLRRVSQHSKRVPFNAEDIGLDKTSVEYLRSRGIIYDDGGEIYITELVRVGLGFEMGNGARPRVVSLRRKILRNSHG